MEQVGKAAQAEDIINLNLGPSRSPGLPWRPLSPERGGGLPTRSSSAGALKGRTSWLQVCGSAAPSVRLPSDICVCWMDPVFCAGRHHGLRPCWHGGFWVEKKQQLRKSFLPDVAFFREMSRNNPCPVRGSTASISSEPDDKSER